MNGHVNSAVFASPMTGWSTLFAQETDQDLEFDEGLEEDDLNQHKPPSRRPLLWILLLLIAVGVVYWTMKPDLAKLPELPSPSEAIDSLATSLPESESTTAPSSPGTIPIPQFGEGDLVTLSLTSIENSTSLTLTSDAEGTRPGPRISFGETLRVIDGATMDQAWMYQVSTASGKQGWISEKHLKKKS